MLTATFELYKTSSLREKKNIFRIDLKLVNSTEKIKPSKLFMVVKAGLVVPIFRNESSDRWKFDQPGTQILLYRGFTQLISADFFCPHANLLTSTSITINTLIKTEDRAM